MIFHIFSLKIHQFPLRFNGKSWIFVISHGFLGNLGSMKSSPSRCVQAYPRGPARRGRLARAAMQERSRGPAAPSCRAHYGSALQDWTQRETLPLHSENERSCGLQHYGFRGVRSVDLSSPCSLSRASDSGASFSSPWNPISSTSWKERTVIRNHVATKPQIARFPRSPSTYASWRAELSHLIGPSWPCRPSSWFRSAARFASALITTQSMWRPKAAERNQKYRPSQSWSRCQEAQKPTAPTHTSKTPRRPWPLSIAPSPPRTSSAPMIRFPVRRVNHRAKVPKPILRWGPAARGRGAEEPLAVPPKPRGLSQ